MNKDKEEINENNENKSNSIEETQDTAHAIDSEKSPNRLLTEFMNEDKSSMSVSDEDIKNFAKSFSQSLRLIEDRIHSVNLLPAKTKALIDTDSLFAEITVDIEDVREYLNFSSSILSEKKLSTCRELVDSLSKCCEVARKRLKTQQQDDISDTASGSLFQSSHRLTQMLLSQTPIAPRTSLQNIRRKTPRSPPPPPPPIPPPMPSPVTPLMPLVFTTRRKSRAQHISRKKTSQRSRSPVMEMSTAIDESKSLIRAHCSNVYIRFLRVDTKDKEVTMKFMSGCFIELQGKMPSLYIMEAYDSIFLCGYISETLRMANCKNCTVFAVANRVILRSTSFSGMFLFVNEYTTIENCHHMQFGEYNYYYANSEEDTGDVSLCSSSNNYRNIIDCTTIQQFGSDAGADPQRNWKLIHYNSIPDWNFMRGKFKESVVERYNKPNLN